MHVFLPPACSFNLQKWGFSLEDLFITAKLLILLPFQLDKTSWNDVLHGILSWITKGYSKLLQEKEMEYTAHLILHHFFFFFFFPKILELTLQ